MGELKELKMNRLSYSSSQLLQNCKRKYWHYKVNKTKKDTDVEVNEKAFNIGKAFHEVLEETLHEKKDYTDILLHNTCETYSVAAESLRIKAMLMKYYTLHEAIGLKVVVCEMELKTDIFIGYIDVILIDEETGNWWIADMKTAARLDNTIVAKLKTDFQLNLYAYHAGDVAKRLKLPFGKFQGVRYRVTTKSLLKKSMKETEEAYLGRVAKSITSVDIPIYKKDLCLNVSYDRFLNLYQDSENAFGSKEQDVMQNFGYCNSYFKPCEYWSKCHGQEYSSSDIEILDIEAVKRKKLYNDQLLEQLM